MARFALRPGGLAVALLAGGCSAILPLGDEYTFGGGFDAGELDGGTDASSPVDGGDPSDDAGCEPPQADVVCADRCGEIVVCGRTFTCGTCEGELECGGTGTANQCGCAEPPCALFAESFGDASEQVIRAIAVDHEGNVLVAGDFRGTITFGADTHVNPGSTRYDMFLVKLDPAGNVLWSRAFGSPNDATTDRDQRVHALAVDGAGNVIIAGETYGPVSFGGAALDDDIVIAKLDPDGNHLWSAAYGTEYSARVASLAIDPGTYDVLVGGYFWGTLRFGSLSAMTAAGTQAYYDLFLARLRAVDGVPQSSRRFGDGDDQVVESIATTTGYVHVAATFRGSFDFGTPNPTMLGNAGSSYSLAIAKLSSSTLSHVWSRQLGSDVVGAQIATDASGNVYVAGSFTGTLEVGSSVLAAASPAGFLARFDADGTPVWGRSYDDVTIRALATGADGSAYLAGRVTGPANLGGGTVAYSGTPDAFIARLDGAGELVFARVFSAAVGSQAAVGIAEGPGSVVWAGVDFQGNVDLGTGELRTLGGTDVAVARFVP